MFYRVPPGEPHDPSLQEERGWFDLALLVIRLAVLYQLVLDSNTNISLVGRIDSPYFDW